MKKRILLLITLLFSLFTINVFGYTAPSAPPNGTYILDLANKLSIDDLNKLNFKIENINKTTKNEFGVLLLQNMNGSSIDDVAYTVFNSWGIGKRGLDNGVLLVISFAERKTRIETGKGVEELTDLQSSDILQNVLKPQLKAGKVYDGINNTINACSSKIESRATAKLVPVDNNNTPNNENLDWVLPLIIFGIGGSVFGFVLYTYYSNKKERESAERAKEEAESRSYYTRDTISLERQRARAASVKSNLVTKPDLPNNSGLKTAAVIGGAAVLGAAAIEAQRLADKKRRERDEEDRRRRDREEESRSSSSSYNDSGSSWGGGGSDSGFGGGDSGGGGSSGGF